MYQKDIRIKAGKVNLACRITGRGGMPLVFIHGLSANLMCFQHLQKGISCGIKASCLSYDLRGRGQSDKPEGGYGPHLHATDLDALLKSRTLGAFQKKPIIIAHSLGAYVALEYASLFPKNVGGLVLLDGGGSLSKSEALRVYLLLRLSFIRLGKRFKSEDAYLNLVRKSPLVKKWTPELEALLKYDMITDERGTGLNLPVHVIESELQNAGASLSFSKTLRSFKQAVLPAPDFTRIQCPTLVVRAKKKNLFPGDSILTLRAMKKMKSQMPRLETVEIEANHYSMILEDQPVMNERIIKFLNQTARVKKRK